MKSLTPTSKAFIARCFSSGSQIAKIGILRVPSWLRTWAAKRNPSNVCAEAEMIMSSTVVCPIGPNEFESCINIGRCSVSSVRFIRAARRGSSSTTSIRAFVPSSRAIAPSITPMRRPAASRRRNSSATALYRASDFTRAKSVTSSIGFDKKSSAPTSSPRTLSSR